MAFAPDLPVIAPWREWDIRSREDAIAYAAARNIPVAATKEKIYSRDRNLWHISHEGGILEDPAQGPPKDVFMLSTDPEDAPNEPEEVRIGFDAGTPVSVNGTELDPVDLIAAAERDRRASRRRPHRPRRGSHGRHEVARRLRDAGRYPALLRAQ